MSNNTNTPTPPAGHSSFGTWRRPVILVLAVTVLAISSPFLYMDGVNKENFWITALGQLGIAISVLFLFVLPFLPKRFGFRLYDFLAILLALLFAAFQAPNTLQKAPPEGNEAITINEDDARRLAEQLQEYASEQGTETLPAYFLDQLEYLGEATVEIRQQEAEGTIYEANTDKYLFKLMILLPENAGKTGFTFTALAAPSVDMKSFFIDKNGETISLNTNLPI